MDRFNTCGPINCVPDGLGMYYTDYLAKLAEIRAAVEAEREAEHAAHGAWGLPGINTDSPDYAEYQRFAAAIEARDQARAALDALLSEAE